MLLASNVANRKFFLGILSGDVYEKKCVNEPSTNIKVRPVCAIDRLPKSNGFFFVSTIKNYSELNYN